VNKATISTHHALVLLESIP